MTEYISLYRTIVNTMKELGSFSVIPLNGKKPHQQIKTWEKWQTQQPSSEQIAGWFANNEIQAYAIITGRVSDGLFVIDFDKIGKYRKFKRQFPELASSYTVRTRRGRHVYLRTAVPIRGRRFKGGDLQAEGQYVVGPGSIVDGYQYKVETNVEVAKVNKDQYQKIVKWLTARDETEPIDTDTKLSKIWTMEEIQEYYRKQTPKTGRNNALYTAATRARAIGSPLAETIEVLANQHTRTEPSGQHRRETYQQRYQEAVGTITSAYTGTAAINPATWKYKETETKGAIPNSLREAMLKAHKTTIPGRLLEACIFEGWQPRQIFTMKAIQEIGNKYKIGDKQIREAVVGHTSLTNKHRHIYKPVIETTAPPAGDTDNITKKGNFGDRDRSKITTLNEYVPNYCASEDGRTPQFFEFPDLTDLCTAFGVLPLASDVLEYNDLTSAKNYLMGLFRELVTRLSPEFSIQWHAERLGVSERTIYRYIAELGIVVTPIFEYVPLGWENVDDESLWQSSVRINQNRNEITPGQWVQRCDGKRFPAIQRVILDWMPRSSQEFVMCYRRPSRLQLPQAGSPVVIPEVIWRRADLEVAPEWGGGQYDFPPVQRIPTFETPNQPTNIAPNVNTAIPAKSINTDLDPLVVDTITDIPEILGLSSCETVLGLLDHIPEEGLVARQRLGLATYEHLNQSLQLISGLGKSRIDQLNDRGIFTLEQVILIGSERLFRMISWRGREYLSSTSCEKWVEDAKILLGWKQLDPKVILEEKRRQEAQKAVQDYKKNVQRFIDYLKSVREWEHEVFGTGEWQEVSWNKLLEWFMTLMRRVKADRSHLLDSRTVDAVHKKIREFCLSYQERIDLFLAKEDWELEEYVLGIRKKWKALKRATSRQLIRFENNNIWTGWN